MSVSFDELYKESKAHEENSEARTLRVMDGLAEVNARSEKRAKVTRGHITADGDKTRDLIKNVFAIGELTAFQNVVSFLLSIGTAAYLFFYWFTNEFFGKNVWTTQTVDGVNKNISTYQMDIASTIILPILIGITLFLVLRMFMAWWNTTKYSKNNRKEKEAAKNDQ